MLVLVKFRVRTEWMKRVSMFSHFTVCYKSSMEFRSKQKKLQSTTGLLRKKNVSHDLCIVASANIVLRREESISTWH